MVYKMQCQGSVLIGGVITVDENTWFSHCSVQAPANATQTHGSVLRFLADEMNISERNKTWLEVRCWRYSGCLHSAVSVHNKKQKEQPNLSCRRIRGRCKLHEKNRTFLFGAFFFVISVPNIFFTEIHVSKFYVHIIFFQMWDTSNFLSAFRLSDSGLPGRYPFSSSDREEGFRIHRLD